MIAKEWRDARWKLLLGVVLLFVLLFRFPILPSYGETLELVRTWPVDDPLFPKPEPANLALEDLSTVYGVGGGLMLAAQALLLGVGLIASEVDKNTIYLLLSRPVGRTRGLMTKYATAAGVLLFSAVSGGVVLFVMAATKGYPLGSVDLAGVVLSVVLLWLGSLFVLGVALLFSVLLRDAIKSFAAASVVAFLFLSPDNWMNYFFRNEYHALGLSEGFPRDATLFYYWFSTRSFLGEGLAVTDFLVCLIAAAVPLLLALWLFNRRAY